MKTYDNLGGNSGVVAYDYDSHMIKVQFDDGWIYEYEASKIGAADFQKMISLAESGHGLNSYINRYIRKRFSNKYKAQV